MATDYMELLKDCPDWLSLEQFRAVAHISRNGCLKMASFPARIRTSIHTAFRFGAVMQLNFSGGGMQES